MTTERKQGGGVVVGWVLSAILPVVFVILASFEHGPSRNQPPGIGSSFITLFALQSSDDSRLDGRFGLKSDGDWSISSWRFVRRAAEVAPDEATMCVAQSLLKHRGTLRVSNAPSHYDTYRWPYLLIMNRDPVLGPCMSIIEGEYLSRPKCGLDGGKRIGGWNGEAERDLIETRRCWEPA